MTINDTSGVPTNKSLETVAGKVQQKGWYLLGNKLNFTTKEMNSFEKRHAIDRQKQVITISFNYYIELFGDKIVDMMVVMLLI